MVRSASPRGQFLDCCLVIPLRTALGRRPRRQLSRSSGGQGAAAQHPLGGSGVWADGAGLRAGHEALEPDDEVDAVERALEES